MCADEFSQLKRAFMGGFTHANANYVGKVLENVASQDFASSYPAVMLLKKFPMSRSHMVEHQMTEQEFSQLLSTKCCLFDLVLTGVYHRLKHEHPIPRSKCWICEAPVVDNGRIVMADKIGITVTEQDFFTFAEFYEWDNMTVSNFRYYDRQYLPHSFAKAILGLYEKKTKLKDVAGEEVNYMISKNMLNAAFGMSVTNPVRDEIDYTDENTYIKVKPVLEDAIEAYNSNVRRFLFYPWGVWITAYARRNLFTGIKEMGADFVYSDTDSIKYLNPQNHNDYFERYNQKILAEIAVAAEYHHVPIEMFSPLNIKGKKKTIGLWDYEGTYDKFKTLGAKRYLVRTKAENEFCNMCQFNESCHHQVTIAGANKKKAAEYLVKTGDPFGNFDMDLTIPVDYSGRLTSTYIDEEFSGTILDYQGVPYNYNEKSAIHLEPSEYNLSMSQEFIDYLKGLRGFD